MKILCYTIKSAVPDGHINIVDTALFLI